MDSPARRIPDTGESIQRRFSDYVSLCDLPMRKEMSQWPVSLANWS